MQFQSSKRHTAASEADAPSHGGRKSHNQSAHAGFGYVTSTIGHSVAWTDLVKLLSHMFYRHNGVGAGDVDVQVQEAADQEGPARGRLRSATHTLYSPSRITDSPYLREGSTQHKPHASTVISSFVYPI